MSQHRSLKFTHLPLPVVVHATWQADNSTGTLRMFTDRAHAERFLKDLPSEEANGFAPLIPALAQDTSEPTVEIVGDSALSLTNGLIAFERSVASYTHLPAGPDLLGYWGPAPNRENSDGMLMWFDEEGHYHAAIVRSKPQARRILADLYWLDSFRQEQLIRQVGWWNIAEKSEKEALWVEGSIAQLLNNVSVIFKAMKVVEQGRH
jgi:hypothetical protein